MTEKIGLQSVFDNKDFKKGLDEYLKGLDKANAKTDQTAGSMSQVGGVMGTTVSRGALAAAAGVGAFLLAIGAGLFILKKFADAIGSVVSSLTSLVKESVVAASRVEELRLVSQLLGQRAGYTAGEIDQMTQAIKDQGVRTDTANKLMIQFARYQLDMAKTADLARVAQDAAVISMSDSSDTLDRLLWGITTYNTRVLRTAGLNVNMQKSFETYAETLDKNSKQLTQAEKVQAALNGVLAEGARITGAYEAAMNTAGKQMRSLAGREIPEFKNALGAPFQEAFLTIARTLREFVKWLTVAISEGGKFYPVMVRLGAIASIVADGFQALVRSIFGIEEASTQAEAATEGMFMFLNRRAREAVDVQTKAMTDMVNLWIDTAVSAFEWGANIIFSLAEGIIQAASTVLVAAMNFIGNILTSWLSGTSPPKVAKDLPKWGLNAMTEFLKGFTQADFDLLKSIQQPLQSVLSSLVQSGDLKQAGALDIFQDISKALIEGIAVGELPEEVFDKILKSTGKFGAELVDLVKKEFELAQAVKEVEEAEKRLEDARKRQQEAGEKVSELTEEYNRLLRAGAPEDQLNAVLAQINAQEEAQQLAGEEAKEAEKALEEAEDKVDVLEEQARLQEQLLAQLVELSKVQAAPLAALGDLAGAGGDLDDLAAGMGNIEGALDEFMDNVREAVLLAKAEILENLGGVWDDLKERWDEKIGPALADIEEKWAEFSTLPVWEQLATEINRVLELIKTDVQQAQTRLEQWWDEHGDSVLTIIEGSYGLVAKEVFPAAMANLGTILGPGLEALNQFWRDHGEESKGIIGTFWDSIKRIWENQLEIVGNTLDAVAAAMTGDWELFRQEVVAISTLMWDDVIAIFGEKTAEIFLGIVTWISDVELSWGDFSTWLTEAVQTLWDWINEKILTVLTDLTTAIEEFVANPVEAIISGFNSIADAVENLWDWLGKLWDKITSLDWDLLDDILPGSMPPLALGISMVTDEMKDLVAEFGSFEANLPTASASAAPSFAPANAPISNVSTTTNAVNMQMTNMIGNEIDLAMFEDRVSRIMINLLT